MAKKILLPSIMGLPPWDLDSHSNKMIMNSMPTAEIFPSRPSFRGGLDLFGLVSDMGRYRSLLNSYGYEVEGKKSIKVAFLADNFPTDTFQNEYGENFLQKFTDVASEGAASINQFLGSTKASESLNKIINNLKGGGAVASAVGGGLGAVKDVGAQILDAIVPKGGKLEGGISTLDRLAAGARIDFPQVWKSSSFSPSYTMTIRLYNPDPRNDELTEKYIIGPIAALMLLGVPLTEDGGTYNWPFLHQVTATGIYDLDPAYIQGITVVKGGDQQQISYNQRMGICDVRIDFGSLYNTMIAGTNITAGRPTLGKYLKGLKPKRSVNDNDGNALDVKEIALSPNRAQTITEYSPGYYPSRTPSTLKTIQQTLDNSTPGLTEEEQ